MTIPQTQKAAQVLSPGVSFSVSIRDDMPVSEPGPNEVLIKLSCTGLWYAPPPGTFSSFSSNVRAALNWATYNPIIGHEGIGTIIKTHSSLSSSALASVGERVGVKWLYSACGQCSVCKRGLYHHCAQQRNTSRHVPGTLQQFVVADARFLTRIPAGLREEVAAPLLCAGLTMVGAIDKLDSSVFLRDAPKDEEEGGFWVVISGSGGGLGHIGVQIASRIKGYRVIAIDSGEEKRRLSLECGAEAFIDFKTTPEMDVSARVRELTGGEGAHATIVVPGTKEAFEMAPNVVRNMGVIVCVGLPRNEVELPISATMCAARGISIIGSSVGSEEQMTELLQYALDGRIEPVVKVYEFEDTADLINGFIDDAITGKVVVKIPQ
ncbi:Alcohol dehydrogenase 2 [Talaromyces pinophilus]|nr:Alcohol dehydrogenase 2 [Talaromyces pinophilus]